MQEGRTANNTILRLSRKIFERLNNIIRAGFRGPDLVLRPIGSGPWIADLKFKCSKYVKFIKHPLGGAYWPQLATLQISL